MLKHAERHRKLAPGRAQVQDTNDEEASVRELVQEPAQEPEVVDLDMESEINSILNDPTGDIPYRSPNSQRDDDFDMPSVSNLLERDERPNRHAQPSPASFDRSVIAYQSSVVYSEGSSDGTDSDIPFSKAGKPLPPTEEEMRDAEEFVATRRLAGYDWGKISQKYTRRFRIRRSTQYLVNKYPRYRDAFIKEK